MIRLPLQYLRLLSVKLYTAQPILLQLSDLDPAPTQAAGTFIQCFLVTSGTPLAAHIYVYAVELRGRGENKYHKILQAEGTTGAAA